MLKIVTLANIEESVLALREKEYLSLDCETTGLRLHQGDKPFSIAIGDSEDQYYFNCLDYGDGSPKLHMEHLYELYPLFNDGLKKWFMHNAKFDLKCLELCGFQVKGRVWCTMTMARVLDSDLEKGKFNLGFQAGRLGYEKDDRVKEYLTKVLKQKNKSLDYTKAPFNLIMPYACKDIEITHVLGLHQVEQLRVQNDTLVIPKKRDNKSTTDNEIDLLRVVYDMENRGVKIDKEYCLKAMENSKEICLRAMSDFKEITGKDFLVSPVLFKEVFKDEKENWVYGKRTAKKGEVNPQFDAEGLKRLKNPAARSIELYRNGKTIQNFFTGFLRNIDSDNVLHGNFSQHGATTGRFTSSSPNLQNLRREDEDSQSEEISVRRAIVPRHGNVFHMLDYDQMEYRLILHYVASRGYSEDAGVMKLIKDVRERGVDIHQATADITGLSRKAAKTLNFALLYGSGIKLMAENLRKNLGNPNLTEDDARKAKHKLFKEIPEIIDFVEYASNRVKKDKYLVNWLGRCIRIADKDKSYRATNYLIQSGCASIMKKAMVEVDEYLKDKQTKIVLTIHDELVLEGPPDEAKVVVPWVKAIMETVFESKYLPLTCGIEHSATSLADKKEGIYGHQ